MKLRWPGQAALEARIEDLEHRNYTDAITAALLASASGGTTIQATATGALEAASGFVGRAFAAAEVDTGSRPIRDVLTPACLNLLGRSLIAHGEMLLLIRVRGGELRLFPAQSWDVLGDPDPRTWRYRVTLGGASTIETYQDVPAESVIHVQYSFDPREPWRGQSPLTVARLAGRLSAEVSAALSDEASGPRGSFMPVPVDGNDPTIAAMKADARDAKGNMLFAETGDWDTSGGGKYAGWMQQRFGANPPAALVELHKRASTEVYAACGLSMALFDDSDGTSKREAYRQALHGSIAPLGRIVAAELSRKLETAVSLDWTELRAADIAGRARAFQSLVGGGMDITAAAAASGILTPDG
ncbi:MAG: phage portal protein [Chromatiales bacterium]|nr:phage portal protein [Chromatiales bacterium]